MDLPVVIDSHHPDDRLGLAVPSHHHHPGTDAGRVTGLAQRGPAESLIVFGACPCPRVQAQILGNGSPEAY